MKTGNNLRLPTGRFRLDHGGRGRRDRRGARLEGFTVPIDKKGAKCMTTIHNKLVNTHTEDLKHWWKIFHAAGEDWTMPSRKLGGDQLGLFHRRRRCHEDHGRPHRGADGPLGGQNPAVARMRARLPGDPVGSRKMVPRSPEAFERTGLRSADSVTSKRAVSGWTRAVSQGGHLSRSVQLRPQEPKSVSATGFSRSRAGSWTSAWTTGSTSTRPQMDQICCGGGGGTMVIGLQRGAHFLRPPKDGPDQSHRRRDGGGALPQLPRPAQQHQR